MNGSFAHCETISDHWLNWSSGPKKGNDEMSKKLDVELIAGGAVKSDGSKRGFAGYGIVFSDQFSPDCDQEYFTKQSDFWLEDRVALPCLYEHGKDPTIGKEPIGRAVWSIDERGVFFSGELYNSEHADEIMQLIESESLGFSSGALSPWVRRVEGPFATFLSRWPIFELSVTSRACERRTQAVPLKSHRPAALLKCDSGANRFERARAQTRKLALRAIADDPSAFSETDKRRWGATTDWMVQQQSKRHLALDHYGRKGAETLAEAERLKSRYERLVSEQEISSNATRQLEGRIASMRIRWSP